MIMNIAFESFLSVYMNDDTQAQRTHAKAWRSKYVTMSINSDGS